MSAFIETSTDLSKLARSLGRSIGQFTDPDKQFVLDFKYPEDVNRKISAHLQVLDSRPG
jgi:hypothetical protein